MRWTVTTSAVPLALLCAASLACAQAEISLVNPIGLGWSGCSTTNPTGVFDASFQCENETVNPCRVFRLLPTFVSTITDPGFAGSTTTIDVLIGWSPTVGEWWAGLVPGGCRTTPTFSTVSHVTAAGPCRNLYPYGAATLPGQAVSNNVGTAPLPNRYRVSSANSVYPTQALTIGERAYAMQLELRTEGTLADCDPAVDPTAVCTDGCLTPACLMLNDISIFMEVGTGNPNPDIIHYQSDGGVTRNWATWQGGTSYGCPGFSPVTPSTWGAVKALYR